MLIQFIGGGSAMHRGLARRASDIVVGIGSVSIVLGGLLAEPARADLLVHHDLPYVTALTVAQAAVESCAAKGYAVSAVVVDRDGQTIVAIRGDNAGAHTMENARRKAYTAMTFKVSTTEYAKRFAENNPVVLQQVTLPGVIAIPGGLPIKVANEVVGGVGASGSPGVDEPCVQAGLDKAVDQLR
jgi:uncharacterized protein GlcG (DUF336 family)